MKTVKVVKGDRYAIINESDFDPARHVLYEDKPAELEPVKPRKGRK